MRVLAGEQIVRVTGAVAILFAIPLACSRALACGAIDPNNPPPARRAPVEFETAVTVYGVTAVVSAIAAPTLATVLDRMQRFPALGVFGLSLASGFGGFLLALTASETRNPPGSDCDSSFSELYVEHVIAFDLIPAALAAAPTLIAWPLAESSTTPPATASLGLLMQPGETRRLGLVARLRF